MCLFSLGPKLHVSGYIIGTLIQYYGCVGVAALIDEAALIQCGELWFPIRRSASSAIRVGLGEIDSYCDSRQDGMKWLFCRSVRGRLISGVCDRSAGKLSRGDVTQSVRPAYEYFEHMWEWVRVCITRTPLAYMYIPIHLCLLLAGWLMLAYETNPQRIYNILYRPEPFGCSDMRSKCAPLGVSMGIFIFKVVPSACASCTYTHTSIRAWFTTFTRILCVRARAHRTLRNFIYVRIGIVCNFITI